MKTVSYAGETFSFSSGMRAKKSWFGWSTPDMVRNKVTTTIQPKIYATNTERCSVGFFEKFQSHRPVEMNVPESPFYLAVRHNRRSNEEVWYKIGTFLSTGAKNAGLQQEGKE